MYALYWPGAYKNLTRETRNPPSDVNLSTADEIHDAATSLPDVTDETHASSPSPEVATDDNALAAQVGTENAEQASPEASVDVHRPEGAASSTCLSLIASAALHAVDEDDSEFVLVDEHIQATQAPTGGSNAAPSMEPCAEKHAASEPQAEDETTPSQGPPNIACARPASRTSSIPAIARDSIPEAVSAWVAGKLPNLPGLPAPPINEANDAASMKQGIIKSAKNRTEFTILLVGETGVGKTCFLSFFANVIEGRSPTEYVPVHDVNNEQGGSQKCSQTQAARVYEFRSRNDVKIRILDTPGLADTRGISKDQEHKKSIAETIRNYIPVVNAVIVLANGTQPRLGVATDYALTTLTSIFPRSLRDNIAFLFTNVSNALSWNFEPDSIPSFLQSAQQLIVDNPYAMRERYLRIIAQSKHHNASVLGKLERSITSAHDDAVEELVKLFDWMDGLEPQPTTEILNLYNKLQGIETRIENALASMAQATTKKKELEKIKASMDKSGVDMKTYQAYEKVIRSPTWIQDERDYHNTLCSVPKCYSNCHQRCGLNFSLDPSDLVRCSARDYRDKTDNPKCVQCRHGMLDHRHYNSLWMKKEEVQTSVDESAKARFFKAKLNAEQQAKVQKEVQDALDAMSAQVSDETAEIGRLAEEYSQLSLSGNLAGQVQKAVRMVELHAEAMAGQSTDEETMNKVQLAIKTLKDKLDLLNKAKASLGAVTLSAVTRFCLGNAA